MQDGSGGSFEEYAMLRLRLSEGLTEKGVFERFGHKIPQAIRSRCAPFAERGLLIENSDSIHFTKEGFCSLTPLSANC